MSDPRPFSEFRPCPRCGATARFDTPYFMDGGQCRVCGQFSSNAEIRRGVPWTQEEIDQMRKVTK